METKVKPLSEINAVALKVLYKEIGVVDATRFMSQFLAGKGNYTEDRGELLKGLSHTDIVKGIKKSRKRVVRKKS